MCFDINRANILSANKVYMSLDKTFLHFLFLINNEFMVAKLEALFSWIYSACSNNYIYLLNSNTLSNKIFKISVIRPQYRRYKTWNIFKSKLARKKRLFTHYWKFHKFFSYSAIAGPKKMRSINIDKYSTILDSNHYLRYSVIGFKIWHFLVGGLISQLHWDFNFRFPQPSQRVKLFPSKNFLFKSTQSLINYSKNFNNEFLLRKLYINNFFYVTKLNLYYNDLRFLFVSRPVIKSKIRHDRQFLRPYLFLNNATLSRFNYKTPNQSVLNLFKIYSKTFNLLKRARYTPRKFNNFNFIRFTELFLIKPKFWIKNKPSNCRTFVNRFSIFNRKSGLNLLNKIILKKTFKRARQIKILWISHLRNKFFSRTPRLKWALNLRFLTLKKNTTLKLWGRFLLRGKKSRRKLKKTKKTLFWYNFINQNLKFKANPIKLKKLKFIWKKTNKILKTALHIYFKTLCYTQLKNEKFKRKHFFGDRLINLNKTYNFGTNKILLFLNYNSSEIYANLLYPVFLSKEKTPFILTNLGFIYLTETASHNSQFKLLYNLKKLLYSFALKNEVQKYILKRYTKASFISYFYNSDGASLSALSGQNMMYSSVTDHRAFNNLFYQKNTAKTTAQISYLISESLPSKKWTYFKTQFNYWKNFDEETVDFNIKRIRFKPGYMAQWRDARSVLKLSLDLKMKYQYRLTRYLSKYNKFTRFKSFLILEMQFLNILIKSRFLPDNNLVTLFLQHNLLFLNGRTCNNPHLQVFAGDLVQLMITIKYYVLYRWFANWTLKKKLKLKRVLKRKSMMAKDIEEKKRSYLLPKWILFSKNALDDTPNYMEIDYFTLSFFILYEPFQWSELNYYNILNTRFSVINLYNWKYIN